MPFRTQLVVFGDGHKTSSRVQIDYHTGEMRLVDPSGRFVLECESSGIAVVD
jgi:hypothetical protein